MADVIYAEPYALKGGVYYYGKTIEYSVAAYASRRLGFYHGVAGSTNENFINLLNAMVNYGTLAQKYFNYNVDNLMSDVVSAGKHATLTHIEALAPTCTEAGHAEYWQCECGQLFADADGKTTLDAIPTLAPLGHDYIRGICSRCEDIELTDTKFFTFTLLSDNTYSVKANSENKSSLPDGIVIPYTYNGKAVTIIEDSAFSWCNFKTVIISNGIKRIKKCAFEDCHNVSKVILSNNLVELGDSAFSFCYSLQNVIIPDSVQNMGENTFNCCWNITEIIIPYGITSIKYGTFYDCRNLKKVTLPMTLNKIEATAFKFCNKLSFIDIPDNVTFIGDMAFSDCGLTSFTIPENITQIGAYTFYKCGKLKSIIIPENVEKIMSYAFADCTGLNSLTIGSNVKTIGNSAFNGCENLTVIQYLGNIDSWCRIDFSSDSDILSYAESFIVNDEKIENLTIPDTLKNIKPYSFKGYSALTTLTIRENITTIGIEAFSDCDNLSVVTLGLNLTNIDKNAFYNCTELYKIYNNSNLNIVLGTNTYGYIAQNAIILVDKTGKQHTLNNSYAAQDDFIYSTEKTYPSVIWYTNQNETLMFPLKINNQNYIIGQMRGIKNVKHVVIQNGVTKISDSAFYGCKNLLTFSVSSGLRIIGNFSFYNCSSLTTISIGAGVMEIRDNSFANCKSLTKITFDGRTDEWKFIKKSHNWNSNTGDYTVYCTDGKLDKNDNEITD